MLSFDFILCGLLKNRDRPHFKKGTDLVYKPKKRAKKTGTDLVIDLVKKQGQTLFYIPQF